MARRTRAARSPLKGCRRSRVLATGSSSAAAGTSLCVGCRAAESSIFGLPICLANSSHSSMARSGSGSRRSRGVSSCSAAVRMLSFIGRGLNPPPVGGAFGAVACSIKLAFSQVALRSRPPPGGHRGAIGGPLIAERRREQHEHHGGKGRRIEPNGLPVVRATGEVQIVNEAGGPEPHQHAHTVGRKRDQALGRSLVL